MGILYHGKKKGENRIISPFIWEAIHLDYLFVSILMFSSNFEPLVDHLEWKNTKYCYLKGSVSLLIFWPLSFHLPSLSITLPFNIRQREKKELLKGPTKIKRAEQFDKNHHLYNSIRTYSDDFSLFLHVRYFYIYGRLNIVFSPNFAKTWIFATVNNIQIRRAYFILKVKQKHHPKIIPVWELFSEQPHLFIPSF